MTVEAVDLAGAGDAFGGTLTWCLSQRWAFEDELGLALAGRGFPVGDHSLAALGKSRLGVEACR
ncbi:hypothetical protein ACN6KF_005692 [Labrys sp. La1]|uniref:hypothetical protein n=1 Tax=Labrys sp. La1 TaxID=3404917 RepID=UPI003EB9DCA8